MKEKEVLHRFEIDLYRCAVTTWVSRIALDIIGAVAFGYDFACGESEGAEIIIDTFEKQTTLGMSVRRAAHLACGSVDHGWAFLVYECPGRVKTLINEKVGGVLLDRRREVEEGRENPYLVRL